VHNKIAQVLKSAVKTYYHARVACLDKTCTTRIRYLVQGAKYTELSNG
jgi:hypothetical protein